MKIKSLLARMNDHGTRPRVKIWKCSDCAVLIFEGRIENVPDEIGIMNVTSFTISGVGFLEIYTR